MLKVWWKEWLHANHKTKFLMHFGHNKRIMQISQVNTKTNFHDKAVLLCKSLKIKLSFWRFIVFKYGDSRPKIQIEWNRSYFESMIFDITSASVISWKDINSSHMRGFLCVMNSNQPFFELAASPRWKIRYESSICFIFFRCWMLSKNSWISWNLEIVRNNQVKILSIM